MCVSIQSAVIIIRESITLCDLLWNGCLLDIDMMMWFSTKAHRSSRLQLRANDIDNTLQQLFMIIVVLLMLLVR